MNITIEAIENCLREITTVEELNRPNIPGLVYASDKFWEDVDKGMLEYVNKVCGKI